MPHTGSTRPIVALLLLVVVALVLSPAAKAQCSTGARPFASVGGGMNTAKARWDPVDTEDLGDKVRFWDPADSDLGNNWSTPAGGSNTFRDPRGPETGCPGTSIWVPSQTTLRAFNGALSSTACGLSSCPDFDLLAVVEECQGFGLGCGPSASAYFTANMVSRFHPASTDPGRQWDFAVPSGSGTFPMVEFPQVGIVASGSGPVLTVNLGIGISGTTDVGISVYVDTTVLGSMLDSAALASVDILEHIGAVDPGRERNAGCSVPDGPDCLWETVAKVPYADAPITFITHEVPCAGLPELDDIWLAAGLTFRGGGGAKDVESLLVGRAVAVQCSPTIAQPDGRRGLRPDASGRRFTPREPGNRKR